MTINDIQDQIIHDFSFLNTDNEILEYVIDLGKNEPNLEDNYKIDQYRIQGCMSSVWCVCNIINNNRLTLQVDSDALITKGLITIIKTIYNNQKINDIIDSQLYIFDRINIRHLLGTRRNNGLMIMLDYIKTFINENQYYDIKMKVIECLRSINDPEINNNIYDLNMVQKIIIDKNSDETYNIGIQFIPTTPECPFLSTIISTIKFEVELLDDVSSCYFI